MQDTILNALNKRIAMRTFDPNKKLTDQEFRTILESARLAPSSLGLEPWKFIVVENTEVRAKIREAAWGQAQVTEASHLIVVAYRYDVENTGPELLDRTAKIQNVDHSELGGLKQMVDGAISNMKQNGTGQIWAKSQAYIPLGMMIETAALLGIDTSPMEGFNGAQVDEILDLKAKNLRSTALLAVGYRDIEKTGTPRPKVRRSFEEVVEFVK